MNKISDGIGEDVIKFMLEPDRETAKDIVEYLVPDDAFAFLSRQPANDDSPAGESPSLATLRRNMNLNKEIDKK